MSVQVALEIVARGLVVEVLLLELVVGLALLAVLGGQVLPVEEGVEDAEVVEVEGAVVVAEAEAEEDVVEVSFIKLRIQLSTYANQK